MESFWAGSGGVVLLTGHPIAVGIAIDRWAAAGAEVVNLDLTMVDTHHTRVAAEMRALLRDRPNKVALKTQRWDLVEAFSSFAGSRAVGKLVRVTFADEPEAIRLTHFDRNELAVAVRGRIEIR